MLLILLFLYFSNCVYSANNRNCDGQFTDVYQTVKNDPKSYIQFNTFGGYLNNKCLDLKGKNYKTNYLKQLSDNSIKCIGMLCDQKGEFGCAQSSSKDDCYQVEHIVDKKNTPYDDCDTNILGNVVMAYGKWNNAVGGKCWEDIVNEKISIYGANIFCSAIENILECDPECQSFTLPEECDSYTQVHEPNASISVKNFVLLGLMVAFKIIVLMVVIRTMVEHNNRHNDLNYNSLENEENNLPENEESNLFENEENNLPKNESKSLKNEGNCEGDEIEMT